MCIFKTAFYNENIDKLLRGCFKHANQILQQYYYNLIKTWLFDIIIFLLIQY